MHAPALQGRLLTSAEACIPTHPLPTSQLCVRQRCARVVVQGSCESSQVFCSAPAASTMSGTMTYATSSGLFSAAASTSIFPVMNSPSPQPVQRPAASEKGCRLLLF